MTNWRPINTAPKDGTSILLLSDEYVTEICGESARFPPRVAIGYWNPELMSWVDKWGNANGPTHTLEKTGGWSSDGGWFQPNEITHWMPIPYPPTFFFRPGVKRGLEGLEDEAGLAKRKTLQGGLTDG